MRQLLLIISKDPEFDPRGEVVLGQCEPFTSGWKLFLIELPRKQDILAQGAYTDMRKLQDLCRGVNDPSEIRARVDEIRRVMFGSVTETVAVLEQTKVIPGGTGGAS